MITREMTVENLRSMGYAVTLFSPEELKGADVRDVENQMTSAANETIDILKTSLDEEE